MSIKIHTVSFVYFSDLLEGISDKVETQLKLHIEDSVTWGEAFHTMIHAYALVDNLDIENLEVTEEEYAEWKLLRDRIIPLGEHVMIDLEH